MNHTSEQYQAWVTYPAMPADLKQELDEIAGVDAEIFDRFYQDLSFGTGGLRGEIGAGLNRMNIFTVARATQGLAVYLLNHFEAPSCAIAYDTRNKSQEFAQTAARVLAENGVTAFLFESTRPTPMLSFAVRHKGASAGINITASHNPKEYNGYKVYNDKGNQITDAAAAEILSYITATDPFDPDLFSLSLEKGQQEGLIQTMGEDVDAPYYALVKGLSLRRDLLLEKAGELKILYTPLNGSGNIPVRRVLSEEGYTHVAVVPQQENPDGDFKTIPYPNPEIPQVYELAKEMAATLNPDLIFATDPDCDRIGVLAKRPDGEYVVFSGNQMGVLLTDYIIRTREELGTLPKNGAIISTVVSTPMAKEIASRHHLRFEETLTGFKYIGEKIEQWEETGEATFLFGFEESYGYLCGDFVRDKDAVIAASLIAEMTLYYKSQGQTLFSAIDALYETYGYFLEKGLSFTMKGESGQKRIASLVENLREGYQTLFPGETVAVFEDYQSSMRTYLDGKTERFSLPSSNFVKVIFADGAWFVLRPSGTEPKVKVYIGAKGASLQEVEARLHALETIGKKLVGE